MKTIKNLMDEYELKECCFKQNMLETSILIMKESSMLSPVQKLLLQPAIAKIIYQKDAGIFIA